MGAALFSVSSVATLLLAHALYSGWEHSTASQPLVSSFHSHSTASTLTPVPLDIALEGLVGLVLLIISAVFSSSTLQPTNWTLWAEQVQKDEVRQPQNRKMGGDREVTVGTVHPFAFLEDRKGFLDVVKLHREFTSSVAAMS